MTSATAVRWLADAFGFDGCDPLPDDQDESWIEFNVANCSLMIFKVDGAMQEGAATTHVPWVFVDDLDAHFARAQSRGATIVEPIHQHGDRAYVAEDLEGHRWTFAQARPPNADYYDATAFQDAAVARRPGVANAQAGTGTRSMTGPIKSSKLER